MITLIDIVREKRRHRSKWTAGELPGARRSLRGALQAASKPAFVAEFKRRSPSAGLIRLEADPKHIASSYQQHGATALSVLTETSFFGGSVDDLFRARASVSLPVLRKDFLIDPEEVHGGDAALLIVAILDRSALSEMLAAAHERGIEALVEVHDESECDRALESGAEMFGINNRDLRSMVVDLATTERLRGRIPADRLVVSESGIRTREDVLRLEAARVDALLVGEHLMRASDPGQALEVLRGTGPSV